MMKWILATLFLISFFLFKNIDVSAVLRLNEIYPAPASGEQEWIEIYNDEDNSIDISGYYLNDLANNRISISESVVAPLSFIIINSSNILNNSGDTVYLKNASDETLESVVYSGSFGSDKSYAKCEDGTWQITTTLTKSSSNAPACPTPTQSPTPTPTVTETPTPTPTLPASLTPSPTQVTLTITLTPMPTATAPTPTPVPTSYDNIIISEAMVNPESGEQEWIELYNDNDYEIFLDNWFVDDIENDGSSPKVFSLTIPSKSYGVFELDSSMFNNGGDSVRLLDFNKIEKAHFDYSSSEKGESWGKENDSYCLQEPSKGEANNSCISEETSATALTSPITPTPTLTPIPLTTQTPPTFASTRTASLSPALITTPVQILSSPYQKAMILGSSTKLSDTKYTVNKNLLRSLSFSSISFSILAISSLIFKIKRDHVLWIYE